MPKMTFNVWHTLFFMRRLNDNTRVISSYLLCYITALIIAAIADWKLIKRGAADDSTTPSLLSGCRRLLLAGCFYIAESLAALVGYILPVLSFHAVAGEKL